MRVIEARDRAWKVVQMTNEKQGAAEWLRGIVDEYEAEGARSCSAMAKMFGIECEYETCRSCMVKMMTAIADRIESERALPEGMEWPRFEDGELVKVGDTVGSDEPFTAKEIAFESERWLIKASSRSAYGYFHGAFGDPVKRPTPEVLDADGKPIEVGDVVYFVGGSGVWYAVKDIGFEPGGAFVDIIEDEGRYSTMVNPEKLTHEPPDSWERLEEDAKLAPRDYLEKRGMNPEKTERIASMMADLVRRAKALAKGDQR